MKNKTFSILVVGMFLALVLSGFASALTFTSTTSLDTFSENNLTQYLTITTDENANIAQGLMLLCKSASRFWRLALKSGMR